MADEHETSDFGDQEGQQDDEDMDLFSDNF